MLELHSPQAAQRRHPFIPGLESLRGLAALSVCFYHASYIKAGRTSILPEGTWLRILFNGHMAVLLFFVLSGFVLRLSLENNNRKPLPALSINFLLGRFFRLFPVIIATVLLVAAINWLGRGLTITPIQLLRDAALLDTRLCPHFWTLQLEVFGSVLVLVAFLAERKIGLWVVEIMIPPLIVSSFLGHSWGLASGDARVLYLFLFGYLIAARPTIGTKWSAYRRALLSAAVILFFSIPLFSSGVRGWGLLLSAISCTAVVGFVSTRRSPILELRPLRLLGRISYSFYAVHVIGLRAAIKFMELLGPTTVPKSMIVILVLLCAVGVTVLVALLMYYLVERPGMTFGYRVRRITGGPQKNLPQSTRSLIVG